MNKIILVFLSFLMALSTVKAQKGINFSRYTMAGGKMLMCVDSAAKNVFYANMFQNQPYTSFNFLPEVHKANIQIYFRQKDKPGDYRYTILENDKPIIVNKPIDTAKLKEVDRDEGEILRTTTFGTFPIKDKIITIITYDIQKPQEVYKTIFFGKPIPQAKIEFFQKLTGEKGSYSFTRIGDLKNVTRINFSKRDRDVTLVKDVSGIDYLYSMSIKDKKSNQIIFESNAWKYGGFTDQNRQLSPYVQIDKRIFKKSGDYEIVIQPNIKREGCLCCDLSDRDFEKYVTRHTLSITLDEESYTKKELIIFTLIVASSIAVVFLIILYFTKKRNKKQMKAKQQQENIARLQLNSIRSQLNPHFLFNALSGIQNLMNKSEIDNANKYLSKFARLTRNVLENRELISLLQEKKLLDDYLQMEQLRFGFQYEINHAAELDLTNIEIPSMLLQPFVENAVKHGISQKGGDGKIYISFLKYGSDLELTVTDNGVGFDQNKKSNGLGVPLSASRIDLLNSIYPENGFNLVIESSKEGTNIILTLQDWL